MSDIFKELELTQQIEFYRTEHEANLQRIARLKLDNERVKKLSKENDDLQQQIDVLTAINITAKKPRAWRLSKKPELHQGIANLLVSDLHLDEIIKPEAVKFRNSFNRDIAEKRLKRLAEKFITVYKTNFITGIQYDAVHLWFNGDIFSGIIHEELRESNADGLVGSIDYWIDPTVNFIVTIADTFKTPVVFHGRVGNHGRLTPKQRYKGRIRENIDWLFYRNIWRSLRNDSRFTWDIPESFDGDVQTQYNYGFLATHGDQFKGGSGATGLIYPLSMAELRKSRLYASLQEPYNYCLIGHFHTDMVIPRLVVNGSLKGWDEYAYGNNLPFEEPQQQAWITTPEHGLSFPFAINVMSRQSEGW